ncbi:putative quinol monooxygenase [Nocardioides daeguensis]|uniref:ABM domain-containing protein n=1 Tax=Nocardioides daeguensis TaxID=908359 RepID=A0ABP6V2L6_9ACTN|nr:putative quinol monooxygenase [Nocardioides daeguensis]MBV6727192.1 antibiotic biosynthesis monooxygenase [Nocardioides daeguensis]MCR1771206.1 antibiotic biosynthesis monooxygenase [Nocardioides daeguensis]
MIIIHGGVLIDADRVDEVARAAADFETISRAEAGCAEYQLSWRVGPPASLRLLEIWEDEASYLAHTEAAHTQQWSAYVSGVAAGPPAFTRYDVES